MPNLYFHDYVFPWNNWKKPTFKWNHKFQPRRSEKKQLFNIQKSLQCFVTVCGQKRNYSVEWEGFLYLNKIAKAVSIHHSSTPKFLTTNPLLIEKSASYPTVAYFCPSTVRNSVGFLSSVARRFSKKGKGMSWSKNKHKKMLVSRNTVFIC